MEEKEEEEADEKDNQPRKRKIIGIKFNDPYLAGKEILYKIWIKVFRSIYDLYL